MKKLINSRDWGHSICKAYLDVAGDYSKLIDKVLNSKKFPHEMLQEGLKLYPTYLD